MRLNRKRLAIAAGGAVAAVAVLVFATVAGQHYMNPDRITSPASDDESSADQPRDNSPDDGASDDGASSDDSVDEVPEDFTEFQSDEGGFAISYPEDWERIETPPDSTASLVVTPDDRNSLQVRSVDLGFSVGSDEFEGMRQYTSRLVESGDEVNVVAGPSRVELDGLPGYVYVYTFPDPDTDTTGVHSHYFLFDGDRMFTLVFQALPEERYEDLAPTFDTMAETFRKL